MRRGEGPSGKGNSLTKGPGVGGGKQRCALWAQNHRRTKRERDHGDKHGGAKLPWGNSVEERSLSPSLRHFQCLSGCCLPPRTFPSGVWSWDLLYHSKVHISALPGPLGPGVGAPTIPSSHIQHQVLSRREPVATLCSRSARDGTRPLRSQQPLQMG